MSLGIRNGVNVDDLMTAIEAVKTDPTNGNLTFTVKSKWKDGFKANHAMTFHPYQRSRRLGRAFVSIRHGDDVTGAAFDHGYESLSGFRDAFARLFGEPPGRSRAKETTPVTVSRLTTPLGPMIAAATERGVCLLEFADRRMLETQIRRLRRLLAGATFTPGSCTHLDLLDRELQ